MAKLAQCFADNAGSAHDTPEAATIADIAMVLGRLSADSGIAGGVAKLIFDKRAEIEAAFADFDAMVATLVLPLVQHAMPPAVPPAILAAL